MLVKIYLYTMLEAINHFSLCIFDQTGYVRSNISTWLLLYRIPYLPLKLMQQFLSLRLHFKRKRRSRSTRQKGAGV